MPDSNEVERKIRKVLLDMGEEQLWSELEGSLKALDERNQRISDTLEEMLREVDALLLKMDEMEDDALGDKENELSLR
jgi:hypothetical protein